jgi:hypothetical protein
MRAESVAPGLCPLLVDKRANVIIITLCRVTTMVREGGRRVACSSNHPCKLGLGLKKGGRRGRSDLWFLRDEVLGMLYLNPLLVCHY